MMNPQRIEQLKKLYMDCQGMLFDLMIKIIDIKENKKEDVDD